MLANLPAGLLTVDEAAALLRVASKTVRNWVSLRAIPFVRVGGCLRFDGQTLKRWLEARAVPEAEARPPIPELLTRRRGRKPRS
ncbi:MAG: helix-turn-helix domain-containing protein [Candidatus Methylomirabilota bacterium]|jgi:excisionase family DNA binding protein